MPEEATKYPVREMDLATQLGVDRARIKQYRLEYLKRGLDWDKKGPTVYLSDDSCKRIMRLFLPEDSMVDPVHPEIREVTVVRCNFLNRQVLHATNGDGQIFVVRVHDAYKYVPGMTMRVRLPPGQTVAVVEGRGPRYHGRW